MRVHILTTPAEALYRVFVLPTLAQVPRQSVRQTRSLSRLNNHTITPSPSRTFTTSGPRHAKSRPPEKRTQLWDEEIRASRVQLVDEVTNSLLPPQYRNNVLASLDRKTHRLVCVTAPPVRSNPGEEWIPTCKIVSKKEQYEADKARHAQQKLAKKKGSPDSIKTLELNWAIDGNDLGHRLKRAGEFLEEGRKVEIVLAKKKGGRIATPEECQAVLGKIQKCVESVEGAKESKKMEGKVGGVVTLFLEGPKS